MSYREYLGSRTWKRVRAAALRRSRGHCMTCGSELGLEVHHNQYPSHWGHERRDMVVTLCHQCHRAVHGLSVAQAVAS